MDWEEMGKLLQGSNLEKHPKELEEGENDRYLAADALEGDSFKSEDFLLLLLASDSVTNVTSLQWVNHWWVLIFAGNTKGVISYALGKGLDHE